MALSIEERLEKFKYDSIYIAEGLKIEFSQKVFETGVSKKKLRKLTGYTKKHINLILNGSVDLRISEIAYICSKLKINLLKL